MVYLDNAATTKPVYRRSDFRFQDVWFNANSNMNTQKQLDLARESIKRSLGFNRGKILFCRSSTEAVEWLTRQFNNATRFVCSPYEHDSVWSMRNCGLEQIGATGWPVVGYFQLVNQMTGCVQNIPEIVEKHGSVLSFIGCDLTATIGKYPIPEHFERYVDAVWFDAHKIEAEGNIGCLWLSDKLFYDFGGKSDSRNEYGLIHGTPDVEGALMLNQAVLYAMENAKVLNERYRQYNDYLEEKFTCANIEYSFVGKDRERVNGINAIYLPGIDADALTQWLSTKQIYIGKGASACADAKDYRVLEAYGLTKLEAEHTVRISYCPDTNESNLDTLVWYIAEFERIFC